jgi:two-component system response regulator AtoC
MGYAWPGNVRELENVLERAMIMAKGRWITPVDLPPSIMTDPIFPASAQPEHTLSIKKASKHLERTLIQKVLELTGGNRSKAAKILEISRPILIAKIKEYGL